MFRPWPLAQIVPDRDAFFAFLQERWPIFLDRLTSGPAVVRETPPGYAPAFSGPAELPFDHPDVRVYVDDLFLEGALRPVPHPRGREVAEPWARDGVAIDPRADRRRRFDGLLTSVEASLPSDGARHQDWLVFAPRWAQVNALVSTATRTTPATTHERGTSASATGSTSGSRLGFAGASRRCTICRP